MLKFKLSTLRKFRTNFESIANQKNLFKVYNQNIRTWLMEVIPIPLLMTLKRISLLGFIVELEQISPTLAKFHQQRKRIYIGYWSAI